MLYGWLKIFHIVFVTSWFAGLFYLPRIYVNLAQTKNPEVYDALVGMASRLLRFMTIIAVLAIAFGVGLILVLKPYGNWFHVKMLVVLLLIGYHYRCYWLLKKFRTHSNPFGHVFYRWFNEIPVLFLIIAVALVVLKPF